MVFIKTFVEDFLSYVKSTVFIKKQEYFLSLI